MLISELRRALKETADQATVNTRTATELEVHLRKELLEGEASGEHGFFLGDTLA